MTESVDISISGNNSGNIAGRDVVIQPGPSWIEKRKTIKDVIHHFNIFFSLANDINDSKKRVMNPFQDCKNRMNREFKIQVICNLEEKHQKEIFEMHERLMCMNHASECTPVLQNAFLKKLAEISSHYSV
jgi:hypothetical protein